MPVPQGAVSAEEKSRILTEIAGQLREGYVFADKGKNYAGRIERDLAAGLFDDLERLDLFVAELTPYLFEMSNDKHLRVRGSAGPDHEQAVQRRRMVRGAPEGGGAHAPEAGPVRRRQLDAHESPGGVRPPGAFGFESYKLLEGNVGYINLRGFSGDPASKTVADEAMMAIEGADAVILDLRQNSGGAPFMVRYLSAFFFSEPTHLASTMMRGMPEPAERWTLHDGLPTKGFTDTPLYILTSRRTFSAAESFTFGLKVNERITQVGERTGGGGHFGETIRLSDDLELFLPRGRTYDPATGEGWEAEGLQPDIEVPAPDALDAALEAIGPRLLSSRAE